MRRSSHPSIITDRDCKSDVVAYTSGMPNRSRKKPAKDFNQVARSIVDQATGTSTPKKKRPVKKAQKAKDPAAVALGRKGGLKGGKARAAKLSKEQLSASARRAAQARWSQKDHQRPS